MSENIHGRGDRTLASVVPRALGAVFVALAAPVLAWGPLSASTWWHPSSPWMEPWVCAWGLLAFVGPRLGLRAQPIVRAAWFGVITMACAGVLGVCRFAVDHMTTGDLFYGPWLGARRAAQGLPVYDMAGLEEGVNASPFVIALLRPWARTAVETFLPGWLSASALALVGFVVYAWLWLQLLWGKQEGRPGLAELALIMAATFSFTSLQRSLRLGQLDSFVLCLLAAGTYHATRGLCQPGCKERHGFAGAFLLVVATGVKVLPGVTLFGLALAAWQLKRKRAIDNRALVRLLAGAALGTFVVAGVVVWGLGPGEIGRFFSSLPLMLRGSAAGANYAVVSRFAKYADPALRLSHAPLSSSTLFWLWPLRVAVALGLIAAACRLKAERLQLLFALTLAVLPLVSSLVWDIYFVWCAFFPWLLLLLSERRRADRRPVRALRAVLLAGSYFLLGVAGTGLVRNPVTNRVADTGLPMCFDEARLVGLFVVIGMLLWDLLRPEPASIAHPATVATSSVCVRDV